MRKPNSLFTCRYWAFGPGCPNVHEGRVICAFAHWDTGTLASAFDQPGTCKYWLEGRCDQGHACYYEHRATGIQGLYQGRITLNGFNLEVATAAGNAGFNTYDHAGLFDLIWAVKRVALRASKNTNLDQRPPKDPVYPDRFRPSGLGDNTKRKRSTQQIAPPATRAMALVPTIEVRQGERRIFRYKNKKLSTRSNRVNAPTSFGYGSGTQEHPIELLHDDHDASLTAPKRQKLDNSTAPNNKQIANISYPRSVREHRQRSSVNANPTIQHTEDASTDSMHVDGYTYVRTSGRSSDAHDVHRDSIELQSVSDDLSKVKDVLAATAKDMIWCNKSMSNAFDNHRNILAGQGIHPILEKLCKDINGAKTSSIEGVEHLEDVLELLG